MSDFAAMHPTSGQVTLCNDARVTGKSCYIIELWNLCAGRRIADSFASRGVVCLFESLQGGRLMENLWQDVRHAARILLKNPGFTLAAVICLMLGIGATTAIFSVVNAVLLRPLPYKQPNSLIRVYTEFPTFPNGGLHRFWTSPPEFIDLRRDIQSFSSLDAWTNGGANIAVITQPARVTASYESGGLLNALGVSPLMGRLITPQDDDPVSPAV